MVFFLFDAGGNMHVIRFDDLPQVCFAGLIERRFVTDGRVFGFRKEPGTADGIGNFVTTKTCVLSFRNTFQTSVANTTDTGKVHGRD